LLPHILELVHSLLAAHAERSRFCWDEGKRRRVAAEEDPVQMKGAMLMEGTRSHSPQVLLRVRHILTFTNNPRT